MLAQIEKVSVGADESFACRKFSTERFFSPLHFHPECELTLIESSHGLRFVGDSIQRFEPGDLVLLGSGLPHYWENSPDWRGVATSVVVQFHASMLGDAWLQAPEMNGIRRLLGRALRGIRFTGRSAKEAAAQLGRLTELENMPRLLLLLKILHDLSQSKEAEFLASAGYAPVFNVEDQGRLSRVLDYVNASITDGVEQREAARQAGLSPAAFSRYFRRKLGHTFGDFINQVRVGRICRILMDEPERSVAEVAFETGYNNLANFNRQFRRRTGLSPTEYRRKHRGE